MAVERGVSVMNDLLQHYSDDQNGLSYTLDGDFYLPDLFAPEEKQHPIGKYGRMRLNYLKRHRRIYYFDLLTSGKLNSHLHEIDETAYNRMNLICKQLAVREGVTEKLKSDNQMLWVQKMNNIRNWVEEMIIDELIYI